MRGPGRPIALTIAGSDSGGGAGIQADLKTFEAFGVFGTSAITAVTAQNTVGVMRAEILDAALVVEQIEAVAADLRPAALKTGMLGNASIVRAVGDAVSRLDLRPLVVDPVMVATSGDRLLDADAVAVVRDALLPRCEVVTPNLPETELLTGERVRTREEMRRAARRLVELGAGAALVKGGHLEGETVVDVFWDGTTETVLEHDRLPGANTHGTGCTLSAAIVAGLALSGDLQSAVADAIDYTRRAIAGAPGIGSGNGPLDHRGGV